MGTDKAGVSGDQYGHSHIKAVFLRHPQNK